MFSTVNSLAATSISPVRSGIARARRRWRTWPVTLITHSLRRAAARSNSSFGRSDDRRPSASGLRVANVNEDQPPSPRSGPAG